MSIRDGCWSFYVTGTHIHKGRDAIRASLDPLWNRSLWMLYWPQFRILILQNQLPEIMLIFESAFCGRHKWSRFAKRVITSQKRSKLIIFTIGCVLFLAKIYMSNIATRY